MKRYSFLTYFFCLGLLLSCDKQPDIVESGDVRQICFQIEDDSIDMDVLTKATAVTNLTSVNWQCLNGAVNVHSPANYAVSDGSVATGHFWPAGGATYNYRASNNRFSDTGQLYQGDSGTNTTLDNSKDVVVGTASGVTDNSCIITLDHIFARTGTLSATLSDGSYTLDSCTWEIVRSSSAEGTGGSYTIGTGWADSGNTGLTSRTAITGGSDMYLIPGTYTVYVSYTYHKDAYSRTHTKHANVTLLANKINNISATLPVAAGTAIQFNVTLTSWTTNSINVPAGNWVD